jgi:hypothetical protein
VSRGFCCGPAGCTASTASVLTLIGVCVCELTMPPCSWCAALAAVCMAVSGCCVSEFLGVQRCTLCVLFGGQVVSYARRRECLGLNLNRVLTDSNSSQCAVPPQPSCSRTTRAHPHAAAGMVEQGNRNLQNQHDPGSAASSAHSSPASGCPSGMSGCARHSIILTTAHSGVIWGPASTPISRARAPLLYSSGLRGPRWH